MKKLIVAITVMMFGFSAFAQNTGNLLNNYISVKIALVIKIKRHCLMSNALMGII